MAGQLDPEVVYTPIAQDPLDGDDLPAALGRSSPGRRRSPAASWSRRSWCCRPSAQDALPDDPAEAAAVAAAHPDRTEARLAVGVLRDGGARLPDAAARASTPTLRCAAPTWRRTWSTRSG